MQPSTFDEWLDSKWTSSPSYRAASGFGFALTTYGGAALSWGKLTKSDYPSTSEVATRARVKVSSSVLKVFASRNAFVALKTDGTFTAWGASDVIRGHNSSSYSTRRINTALEKPFVANDAAFVGIDTNGGLIAFGAVGHGNNVLDEAQFPGISSALSSGVVAVTATAGSFAALKSGGTVFAWGPSFLGGGVTSVNKPALQGVVRIFATRTAFAALLSSGAVVAWGDPHGGGDASAVTSKLTGGVEHIVASQSVFVAIKTGGSVVAWGQSRYGADLSAVASLLQSGVVYIAQTAVAFAALKQDGTVVSWGEASRGGDSTAVTSSLVNVRAVYGNSFAFAAVTGSGKVVTWGDSGNGGSIPSNLLASLSSGVTAVYSTHRAFAALVGATGQLVVWGSPYHGASPGAAAPYLTSGVRAVCSNDVAFTAVLQDGRAVVWGHDSSIPHPGLLANSPSLLHASACA